jgi:hypothetical protein
MMVSWLLLYTMVIVGALPGLTVGGESLLFFLQDEKIIIVTQRARKINTDGFGCMVVSV